MTPIYETHQKRLSMNIHCKQICKILVAIIPFCTSCDKLYRRGYVKFNNNSNTTVTFYLQFEGAGAPPLTYLDIEDNNYYDDLDWTVRYWEGIMPVQRNSSREITSDGLKEDWERMFWNDTLYVEIFRGDFFEKNYKIRDILENKDMLQVVYKITYEQFQSIFLNEDTLGITYPPTLEMKDIKMWPPYEEVIKNVN